MDTSCNQRSEESSSSMSASKRQREADAPCPGQNSQEISPSPTISVPHTDPTIERQPAAKRPRTSTYFEVATGRKLKFVVDTETWVYGEEGPPRQGSLQRAATPTDDPQPTGFSSASSSRDHIEVTMPQPLFTREFGNRFHLHGQLDNIRTIVLLSGGSIAGPSQSHYIILPLKVGQLATTPEEIAFANRKGVHPLARVLSRDWVLESFAQNRLLDPDLFTIPLPATVVDHSAKDTQTTVAAPIGSVEESPQRLDRRSVEPQPTELQRNDPQPVRGASGGSPSYPPVKPEHKSNVEAMSRVLRRLRKNDAFPSTKVMMFAAISQSREGRSMSLSPRTLYYTYRVYFEDNFPELAGISADTAIPARPDTWNNQANLPANVPPFHVESIKFVERSLRSWIAAGRPGSKMDILKDLGASLEGKSLTINAWNTYYSYRPYFDARFPELKRRCGRLAPELKRRSGPLLPHSRPKIPATDQGDVDFLRDALRRWIADGGVGRRRDFLRSLRRSRPTSVSPYVLYEKYRRFFEDELPDLNNRNRNRFPVAIRNQNPSANNPSRNSTRDGPAVSAPKVAVVFGNKTRLVAASHRDTIEFLRRSLSQWLTTSDRGARRTFLDGLAYTQEGERMVFSVGAMSDSQKPKPRTIFDRYVRHFLLEFPQLAVG